MQEKEILTRTIQELNTDSIFTTQAEKMGLITLKDVMDVDLNTLKQHIEFTMMWYTDLLLILKNANLLEDFQDKLYH